MVFNLLHSPFNSTSTSQTTHAETASSTSPFSKALTTDNISSADFTTTRALPASYYRSPAIYALERRAIFSRHWILVTHRSRFASPGTYLRFREAGYDFFLLLGSDGVLRGWHNVCRHRAFPVVVGPREGRVRGGTLRCGYHGWCYDQKGGLVKGFKGWGTEDRKNEGLVGVGVKVDGLGFVWVNLGAVKEDRVEWEEEFAGVDEQERLKGYDWEGYVFDHEWEMEGGYNWKTLADNYNECYHCSVAHPAISAQADLRSYRVDTRDSHIQHFTGDQNLSETLRIASTFHFPNACMTVSPHFFYMMRCEPTSPTTSHMQYQVFRHKNATDQDFTKIDAIFKQVLREDKDLCNAAQKNLNAGVYVSGQLNAKSEKGTLYVQTKVREILKEHFEKERALGREIWPASQVTGSLDDVEQGEAFCEQVECAAGSKGLQW